MRVRSLAVSSRGNERGRQTSLSPRVTAGPTVGSARATRPPRGGPASCSVVPGARASARELGAGGRLPARALRRVLRVHAFMEEARLPRRPGVVTEVDVPRPATSSLQPERGSSAGLGLRSGLRHPRSVSQDGQLLLSEAAAPRLWKEAGDSFCLGDLSDGWRRVPQTSRETPRSHPAWRLDPWPFSPWRRHFGRRLISTRGPRKA